jgi:uncharacterized protein YcbX
VSASIVALWRYPVSSMAGESLELAPVDTSGVVGDRIWGVVDRTNERIASPGREKHFVRVPHGHARLTSSGSVEISPQGRHWSAADDETALDELSLLFGFPAKLKPFVPTAAAGFKARYDRAPIHLLTTAALRSLRRDLPGSVIDERRFRPNILVDWPDEAKPIPEHDWIGREICVGDVVLRGREPCGRCGFVTIEQEALPLDVEVLRTVVRRYERHFGIYCDVLSPGEIRLGDAVTVANIDA